MLAEALRDAKQGIFAYPLEIFGAILALRFVIGVVSAIPSVGSFISVAVSPFLLTGAYVVISRAIDGTGTDRDKYFDISKTKYVETLVTYVLVVIIESVVAAVMGVFVVVALIMNATIPDGLEQLPQEEATSQIIASFADAALSPMVIVTGLLFILVYGLIAAALQFALPSVVLNNLAPVEAMKQSVSFLQNNPAQIMGYSAFRFVLSLTLVSGLGFVPFIVLEGSLLTIVQSPTYFLMNALLTVPGALVMLTIHVAYYKRLMSP